MKKLIISIIAFVVLVAACVTSYLAGYYHVIYNQHAEKCPDYPNRYHIIIDSNVHEYEFEDYEQQVFTSWN